MKKSCLILLALFLVSSCTPPKEDEEEEENHHHEESFESPQTLPPSSTTQSNQAVEEPAKPEIDPVTWTSWKECETSSQKICGTWEWVNAGSLFHARWDNGADAELHLQRYKNQQIVVTRFDKTGASAGLKATYTGKAVGNTASGTVTWDWQERSWQGTWTASW